MSVRWKPVILLSVLFVGLAGVGLLAAGIAFLGGGTESILPSARAEAKAGKYDKAEVYYKKALQLEKSAPLYEELAGMLADWAAADAEKAPRLRVERLAALAQAARYDKRAVAPRRELLADALARGEQGEALHWARQLQPLDPKDPDAHYALAVEALDRRPPVLSEAREALNVLKAAQPDRPRTAWIAARLAVAVDDAEARDRLLHALRTVEPARVAVDPVERLNLRLLDLTSAESVVDLSARTAAFRSELAGLTIDAAAPARVRAVGEATASALEHLGRTAARQPAGREAIEALADGLADAADSTYRDAVAALKDRDLRPQLAYARHLSAREQRDRCLEVVSEALQSPLARQPAWVHTCTELRELGIKAALAGTDDPERFAKAGPLIDALLTNPGARYQAIGHFFKGVIDLDRSGLARGGEGGEGPDPKLVASAVDHLKRAAAAMPESATAQALYGIALILASDPAVGRQYLQRAQRLDDGGLEPRYQVWAAWSMLQAGYPEEAEPIVDRLGARVASGELPSGLAGGLHLLKAEICQARGGRERLVQAREHYRKAIEVGQEVNAGLRLRLAQLDALLGDPDGAISQIDGLRDEAGAAAEQLAILTLRERGQHEEASRRMAAAREEFPESAELAGLDAAMRLDAGRPAESDAVLAAALARHPGHLELTILRARVLAGSLEKADEARALVAALAERNESSVPLVQLALIDLGRRDLELASRSIARLRERWPEAAAADLLDAQLAFAKGDTRASAASLDAALKKDPNNKVALFWRAQLDGLAGSTSEARQVFEAIVRERPVKQIESGLPLAAAAQWSLAALAMDRADYDGAITRYEALLRDGDAATLQRPTRWKLAQARAAKGDPKGARAEVDALVGDPKTTPDERVRAADIYRNGGDRDAAARQIDLALAADPAHAGALSYRSLMLASEGKAAQAASMLRTSLEGGGAPAVLYLLLAGLENTEGEGGRERALKAVDEGLVAYPDSPELLRARYDLMSLGKDPEAVAFVERRAEADPKGNARFVLIDVYTIEARYEKAERLVGDLLKAEPKDSPRQVPLATQLVALAIGQADQAATRGDEAARKAQLNRAAGLAARYREQFPAEAGFARLEFDVATRLGDNARARRLAREVADLNKSSPLGPTLLARLAISEDRLDEAARAYEEALERAPADNDLRLDLGRVRLALGQHDEAVVQATHLLRSSADDATAALLKAQALASKQGPPAEVSKARAEALDVLRDLLRNQPRTPDAYRLAADIHWMDGRRDPSIDALRAALNAVPEDDPSLSQLVQRLVQVGRLDDAAKAAETYAGRDESGVFALAVAVGYHRAGRSALGVPWAEKAASKLDRPIVHLTFGDILLSVAEEGGSAGSRELFERAVAEYDRVLRLQPDTIEAVNNKAWILHRYLDRNDEALELAAGLARRVDPKALPAEFLDTLGSIQEAVGKADDAERSYAEGLRRSPDHPILNYHMGRLLASRPGQSRKAREHLIKAKEAAASLPREMAGEVDQLLDRVAG